MAGENKTFLRGAHFDDPTNPRSVEFSQHAKNHARPSGVDPRVGTVHKHGMGVPPVHGGMHTRHDGQFLPHAGGNIKSALVSGAVGPGIGDHLSGYPKNHDGGPAPIHPSMNRKNMTAGSEELMHILGRKILDNAEGPHRNGMPRVQPRVHK